MSLDEATTVLDACFAALQRSNFRNDYEALNAYESNIERIQGVRATLATFSGARVDGLRNRCNDLERDWTKRFEAQPSASKSTASQFGGEWLKELQAEDEIDEMEELTAESAQKKKAKAKGKRHKTPAGVDLTDAHGTQRDTKNEKIGMHRGSSLCYLVQPNSEMELSEEVRQDITTFATPESNVYMEEHKLPKHKGKQKQTDIVDPNAPKTIETHELCLSSAIPASILEAGVACPVVPLEGTAFAELQFPTPRLYEGKQVVYHAQMFRAVIAAVAQGPPRTGTTPAVSPTSTQPPVTPSKQFPPTATMPSLPESNGEDGDEEECVLSEESEDDDINQRNAKVWKKMGSEDFEVLHDLSTTLVAEYKDKEEDEDASFSTTKQFPTLIAPPLDFLRHISTSTWVIVMCHGGYFAGAVYANTKPILHKSFHRYVVRKKQGGKQSSHDKGGGSGGSAGGQIRRGQEIKWKVAVRDLLIAWRQHIERAWVILYAAPGPDNRAILTDFSLLPASTSSGVREKSPIDLKDPRVRSAPLTTHRPTFNEVERIFETVSKTTIRIKLLDTAAAGEASGVLPPSE